MLRTDLNGEIVVFKLITKEEIVGKVLEVSASGHYLLAKPLAIVVGRESLQLIPFQFAAPQGTALVYGHNLLIEPIVAAEELKKAYKESTQEIVLDTSSVSGINLRG